MSGVSFPDPEPEPIAEQVLEKPRKSSDFSRDVTMTYQWVMVILVITGVLWLATL